MRQNPKIPAALLAAATAEYIWCRITARIILRPVGSTAPTYFRVWAN